jgi:HlyD family secretion protein
MKRILPILVIVVIAAAAYAVWTSQRSASALGDTLGGSGTIEATNVTVSSPVAGSLKIIQAKVKRGDKVEKGQVLFRLDSTSLNYQIDQAKAGARAAAMTLRLARDDDKSSAEIAQDQAALDQANIAIKMAQLQAANAVITAPIGGVALEVPATVGENAAPGGALAIIGDTSHLTVSVYVPESQIGKVKVGQTGTLTTDSSTGTFPVKVTAVSSQAEFTPASTETKDQRVKLVYEVKLDVTDASGALKPGMPADVKL